MKNRRLIIILLVVTGLLLIPLVGMQFSDEVNWSINDFLVAGGLLLGTGMVLEVILRKVKEMKYRIILAIVLFAALLLVWVELAVGIFGTPFAGS